MPMMAMRVTRHQGVGQPAQPSTMAPLLAVTGILLPPGPAACRSAW